MLSKITFGVDRYGVPSAPQAVATPHMMKKLRESPSNPERDKRIAVITETKKSEATADEASRISRYRFG
jgi:hypothetical protein